MIAVEALSFHGMRDDNELLVELRERANRLKEAVHRQTGGEDMGIEHGCDCGSCRVLRLIGEVPST
jgi:hypothetical protein